MGVNVDGGGGIFPTLCVEFCLVFDLRRNKRLSKQTIVRLVI